jgi:hypothetical protein
MGGAILDEFMTAVMTSGRFYFFAVDRIGNRLFGSEGILGLEYCLKDRLSFPVMVMVMVMVANTPNVFGWSGREDTEG